MVEQDHVKEAEARAYEEGVEYVEVDAELLKQAQDYDHIGRVLAHHVFVDMVKQAVDESMPGASDEAKGEEAEKLYSAALGEKKEKCEKCGKEDCPGGEECPGKKEEGGEAKGEGEGEKPKEETEKEASIKAAVLDRMANDPEYVSYLVGKHCV
jgi:hypothetical protein